MNLAIFASGGGSNARKIIEHLNASPDLNVVLVVCNKKNAGVLDIAAEHGIPTLLIDRASFYESTAVLDELRSRDVDFIALAGFLWLVPGYLVQAYPRRILNIHPALLPKYGGKGMYGHHVHEAVKAAGDTVSGPTIHWVNEHYDEGDIVYQASTHLDPEDTPEDIARKVLALEHAHYPEVVERCMREAGKIKP
jgi:phosphoribosylglycinamide formyltransferase-1